MLAGDAVCAAAVLASMRPPSRSPTQIQTIHAHFIVSPPFDDAPSPGPLGRLLEAQHVRRQGLEVVLREVGQGRHDGPWDHSRRVPEVSDMPLEIATRLAPFRREVGSHFPTHPADRVTGNTTFLGVEHLRS